MNNAASRDAGKCEPRVVYGKMRCESSERTELTVSSTTALAATMPMTSPLVLSAPPEVGHSIIPISSYAPTKMLSLSPLSPLPAVGPQGPLPHNNQLYLSVVK